MDSAPDPYQNFMDPQHCLGLVNMQLVSLIRSRRLPDHLEAGIQDPIHEVEGVEPRVINRIPGQPYVNSSMMDLCGSEFSKMRRASEIGCKNEHKTTQTTYV